jgi:uncharacterized OsmC-like protein
MLVRILDETHVRLETDAGGDGLAVEGENFGPLQMLATSLALCTVSVVLSYGETAGLDLTGFAVEVRWDYVEEPYRVGRYDMTVHVPEGLPVARHRAIIRAAKTCTVHNTLTHSPVIDTRLATLEPEDHAAHHHHHHHHRHHTEHSDDREA